MSHFIYTLVIAAATVALGSARCNTHVSENHLSFTHDLPSTAGCGSSLTFTLKGTTSKDIVEGTIAKVSLELYGIKIGEEDFDICAMVPCPIASTKEVEFSFPLNIPVEVPSGVLLDVTTSFVMNGEDIGCVEGEVTSETKLLASRFEFAEQEVSYLYNLWKEQFDYQHCDAEERKPIFSKNLHRIAAHNTAGETWTMAMNQFGHLEPEEFKTIYASGYKRPELSLRTPERDVHYARKLESLPESVNWVEKGAVTEVKNQGACGSCWSFATTGAIEGAYFLKYGKLLTFSEQELVSCDPVDQGCNGGIMDSAYQWIEENDGLCTEEDYPYVSGAGKRGVCGESSCTSVPNSAPKNFVDVAHDEADLRSAVAKTPVAVAIEADQTAFQFYSRGVLTARCGNKLDHGVLAVGYGNEDGEDYWLVKNSWGPQWGDAGYIKLARGATLDGGECGIQLSPSYPVY